ncbi:unnamed protein product [Cladocopium goreaui]|uniref:RING-type domain-containing protein n=1 Tax=Cladocopium goreaui TaxID=2562237 RepID=A0A9P1C8S2_9DINO|nr:unnamed protein product [Cladocopium goreaui]
MTKEWFPLTGADRKIKDDDDDAEDFNECLQNYKVGDISSCITGCASLLRNAPDLSFLLKVRVWCLQAVALVSSPSPCACGHEDKSKVEPAIFALRCAYLGEADAGRTMEEEHRHLRPLLPAPVPPPAPPPPVAKAEKAPQAVPAPRGEICPTCHQRVEKLKNHKKKCPQRQVPCKLCKTHCSFGSLEKHMRDECENRDVNCDKCDAPMKYKDLNYHQLCQCECGLVRCQNDGCGWSGFRRSEADHRLKCLYLKVTCTHCLMELIQKEMPGHQCDRVDMSAPCSVCLESFSRLERKEIPPVMMLINNRRSCAHAHCLKCAQSWYQRNAEQGLAPCPVCRAEYDSTTPFPDYLLQRETKRRRTQQPVIRPPLPRQEEMTPGKQFFVSPLDVRFTHDSISECFSPYVKDGEQLTNKERLKVLSSAKELLDGDEEPKALEMLDVVWYQKELYVAGTFNRRLCMYRLLALFATERFGLIKVQVKSQDELRQKFSKSLTTKCKGRVHPLDQDRDLGPEKPETGQTVKIRTQNNNSEEFQVGQARVSHIIFRGGRPKPRFSTALPPGQSREELHWPEAVEALGGGDLEEMSPSQSETEEETPSPLQTPVQSKQSPSDLDRVIAATAEFHRMPLDQVRQVLRHLTEEQRWLTCKRFRHDPEFGGTYPAIKRFEKYVQSCLSNGFLERHSMDRDSDGCFEKILKASGVQNPGSFWEESQERNDLALGAMSTDPGAPAFPPPASRAACAARSLSPRKAAASRTFPEPRPPSMAEGSAGAGAAGNSSVSFKAPPATFGRDRSPGRSSVKAPPSCREPRPPVKAPPPPPPAPSSASEARGGAEEVSDGQLWMGKIMNQCSYGWISMLLLW